MQPINQSTGALVFMMSADVDSPAYLKRYLMGIYAQLLRRLPGECITPFAV